jgi:hypothetical protein
MQDAFDHHVHVSKLVQHLGARSLIADEFAAQAQAHNRGSQIVTDGRQHAGGNAFVTVGAGQTIQTRRAAFLPAAG